MKNIFTPEVSNEVIERINKLSPDKVPQWGKMSADQMLAHCNVAYGFVFTPEKFQKPGPVKKFLLKTFLKKFVVGEQPYKINSRTSPDFLIQNRRNFEEENYCWSKIFRKYNDWVKIILRKKKIFHLGR